MRLYCRESAPLALKQPCSALIAPVVHLLPQLLHLLHLNLIRFLVYS
jgi:hypothetical protein